MRRWMLLALVLPLLTSTVYAQTKTKQPNVPLAPRLEPTVADFAYAHDSPRQKFDFWQAKSGKPTPVVLMIHGGDWLGGDKSLYRTAQIKPFLDAGISVAAIDYRFIPQAMQQHVEPPVKAPLTDCARRCRQSARRQRNGISTRRASAQLAVPRARVLPYGWRFTMI